MTSFVIIRDMTHAACIWNYSARFRDINQLLISRIVNILLRMEVFIFIIALLLLRSLQPHKECTKNVL